MKTDTGDKWGQIPSNPCVSTVSAILSPWKQTSGTICPLLTGYPHSDCKTGTKTVKALCINGFRAFTLLRYSGKGVNFVPKTGDKWENGDKWKMPETVDLQGFEGICPQICPRGEKTHRVSYFPVPTLFFLLGTNLGTKWKKPRKYGHFWHFPFVPIFWGRGQTVKKALFYGRFQRVHFVPDFPVLGTNGDKMKIWGQNSHFCLSPYSQYRRGDKSHQMPVYQRFPGFCPHRDRRCGQICPLISRSSYLPCQRGDKFGDKSHQTPVNQRFLGFCPHRDRCRG